MEKQNITAYSSDMVKKFVSNVEEIKKELSLEISKINPFNLDEEQVAQIKEDFKSFFIRNATKLSSTIQLLQVSIVNLSNAVKNIIERLEALENKTKGL